MSLLTCNVCRAQVAAPATACPCCGNPNLRRVAVLSRDNWESVVGETVDEFRRSLRSSGVNDAVRINKRGRSLVVEVGREDVGEEMMIRWLPSERMTAPDDLQEDYEPGGRLAEHAGSQVVEVVVGGCATGVRCGPATQDNLARHIRDCLDQMAFDSGCRTRTK